MATTRRKTEVDLDWPKVLAALVGRCRTPMGAEAARALPALPGREAVAERLAEIAEARELRTSGDAYPLDGFVDVTAVLDRAGRGAVLEAEELLAVAAVVRGYRRLAAHVREHAERAPRLSRLTWHHSHEEAESLRDLEELVAACFEEDGTLSDHASPELAVARAKVRSLKARLSTLVQELIEKNADVLQDRYFTLRDDRYVLPVRTDAHRRVAGIVHGHSGSGQTIYVEPKELTSLGNDLVLAQTEVAREEKRVLAQLSEEAALRADAVGRALAKAEAADLRDAAARLAMDLDAVSPEISSDGALELRSIRHPLLVLDGAAVVPNDITLEAGGVLVVSGPNGGGKTVALKTVGAILMMLRAGLHVPVGEGSRLPVARSLWTDLGDDQSLEQSLSSFAAHMKNIASILEEAGVGDVALLDELAGGTDPEEGAALAAEIAQALAAKGAAVMCTTHYGPLKLLALKEEGFSGASLGFDKSRLSPTFHLSLGAPGVSGAMAAAQRYGLPPAVVEAARERMGSESGRLTELLEELEAERDRLRHQADLLVEERTELDRKRRSLAAEREELRRKARDQLDKETRELYGALRSARDQVRRVEERIKRRRKVTADEAKGLSKTLDGVASELRPGGTLAAAIREDPLPGKPAAQESLRPGLPVFVVSMKGQGEVVEVLKRGKVKVGVGSVTLTVGLDDLRVVEENGRSKGKAPRRPPLRVDAAGDAEVPAMTPENTLDVRGERVDDALREADKFIDRALGRGWTNVFFIHGHGTGALRDALRSHFESSPYVTRWKSGERRQGGEGVTVIWLAD